MTDALDQLADRLDTLPLAVNQAVVGIVERFGLLLLTLNRDYLQKQGERPDGQPLQARGYSPAYASYKKKYGTFTNTAFVDLKFSGDFLASFRITYTGSLQFTIDATDKKAGFLAKYGALLGLREEDVQTFVTATLEPEVRAFISQHLNQ